MTETGTDSALSAVDENRAVLHDACSGEWLEFCSPVEVIEVYRIGEVLEKLRSVEESVNRKGLHAAGFLSYEAGPAFDPALVVRTDSGFPLMWFGLYEEPRTVRLPSPGPQDEETPVWTSSVTPQEYGYAFSRIKEWIRKGDTYQVNYTLRLRTSFRSDPWQFFLRMLSAHQPQYGAFLCAKNWLVCSASPELFFRLDGRAVESRPMKGTASRGLTFEEDEAQARALHLSEKNRAENLMIVDMVRNDLGRIAEVGSVHVSELFAIEKYPTLWQMTSNVRASTDASVTEILCALFPPASITGAPKPRTMEIIAELESAPRRVYTGAAGFISPGRRAQFNVAIRTVLIDRRSGEAEYGVGGGIVWDSESDSEQIECRTKSRVLESLPPSFDLLETMLWTPEEGYSFLELHLARLRDSARYFDYPLDIEKLRTELSGLASRLSPKPHRVRLLASSDGTLRFETKILDSTGGSTKRVAFAQKPVDTSSVFLYHKTTHRRMYEDALAGRPGFDDVLLFNGKGEVTESTIANIVAEIDGVLFTPPVRCGLLPGTCRAWLLQQGSVRERVLMIEEVVRSPKVYLANSVRGMYQVVVDSPAPVPSSSAR